MHAMSCREHLSSSRRSCRSSRFWYSKIFVLLAFLLFFFSDELFWLGFMRSERLAGMRPVPSRPLRRNSRQSLLSRLPPRHDFLHSRESELHSLSFWSVGSPDFLPKVDSLFSHHLGISIPFFSHSLFFLFLRSLDWARDRCFGLQCLRRESRMPVPRRGSLGEHQRLGLRSKLPESRNQLQRSGRRHRNASPGPAPVHLRTWGLCRRKLRSGPSSPGPGELPLRCVFSPPASSPLL